MHNIKDEIKMFDKFEKEDIRELKDDLVKWCLLNPNAVLLFEIKTIYKIYNRAIEQGIEPIILAGNRIEIDDIIIEWYQMEGSKCILKRLISTSKKNIIYNDSASWQSTEIWKDISN